MPLRVGNRTHLEGFDKEPAVALFDFIDFSCLRLRRSIISEKIPRVRVQIGRRNYVRMDHIRQPRSMSAPLTSFREQFSCNLVGQLAYTWVRLTAERSKVH